MVEVVKDLGGSFKLVTLAPRTVREMTQLPKETQKNKLPIFNALTLLVGRQEEHPACKKLSVGLLVVMI